MAHACEDAKEISMHRSALPFLFLPTHAASRLLGRHTAQAAVLALRAIIGRNKTLEVAHQQISFCGHELAFSSRVTEAGELIVDLDVGDPRLADRIVLEEELQVATRKVRGIEQKRKNRGR
jgi:hypothetical protein